MLKVLQKNTNGKWVKIKQIINLKDNYKLQVINIQKLLMEFDDKIFLIEFLFSFFNHINFQFEII